MDVDVDLDGCGYKCGFVGMNMEMDVDLDRFIPMDMNVYLMD